MNKEEFLKIIEEFLAKMGYGGEATTSIKEQADELIFEIAVEDAKYLIGEKGSNLTSLEFLIKMICQRKSIDASKFYLDVNGYRKERANSLKEAAKLAAQKALLTKQAVYLPPMAAFDRKVIHTELSINPNIATTSEGMGDGRHVVVRPFN